MKKNVALVAGGYTPENVISEKSAGMIAKNLDPEKYVVFRISLSRESWSFQAADGQLYEIDKNDFSLFMKGEKINFDIAFIIVHGTPGEDGKLQGYFDMLGIPYTSCNAATSAISMNKSYTKSLLTGIPKLCTAKSVQLFRKDKRYTAKELDLKYPLFIKPNNGGSSIGMSKVSEEQEFFPALEKAFHEDEQVLVEEFIKGREFTVGAFQSGGEVQVLPATEIISSREFFDYEAKYTPGVSQEITPADMEASQLEILQELVRNIYKRLNCFGVVRIDFIWRENSKDFYFLEINTVPGQSENSIIPQQVRAAGMSLPEFYSKLIEESFRR